MDLGSDGDVLVQATISEWLWVSVTEKWTGESADLLAGDRGQRREQGSIFFVEI